MAVITALSVVVLFWAHFAGLSMQPYLTWPIYGLWAILGAWWMIEARNESLPPLFWPVGLGLVAIITATLASGVDPDWGARRFLTIFGYGALFYWLLLGKCRMEITRGVAWAGALMSMFVVAGIFPGNRNVVVAFIYLSLPALLIWRDWPGYVGLGLAALAILATGSRGAWLASLVAILVYFRHWWLLGSMPIIAIAAVWLRPRTIADRVYLWGLGVNDLSIFGRGLGHIIYPSLLVPGNYSGHAHCWPLTVTVELGLPGLAALGWGVWRVIPRLTRGPHGAILAGLLAWLLIDEVVWFWGAGMLAVWLLAEVMRDA